jgi:hypothetical protein
MRFHSSCDRVERHCDSFGCVAVSEARNVVRTNPVQCSFFKGCSCGMRSMLDVPVVNTRSEELIPARCALFRWPHDVCGCLCIAQVLRGKRQFWSRGCVFNELGLSLG